MRFDTLQQCVVEPIRVNEKIKDLLGSEYEISRCRMAEFLNLRGGGPGFTLLIAEHDLLCQIRLLDGPDPEQRYDIFAESQMIIGLAKLQIEGANELVVNNQGSFVMAANATDC